MSPRSPHYNRLRTARDRPYHTGQLHRRDRPPRTGRSGHKDAAHTSPMVPTPRRSGRNNTVAWGRMHPSAGLRESPFLPTRTSPPPTENPTDSPVSFPDKLPNAILPDSCRPVQPSPSGAAAGEAPCSHDPSVWRKRPSWPSA